jgi:hypothetical protein
MKETLTKEEIAKVFAMYLSQEMIYKDGERGHIYGFTIKNLQCVKDGITKGSKILLIPLPKINDEDAIAVAKILGFEESQTRPLFVGKTRGKSTVQYWSENYSTLYPLQATFVFQYLISKGYAVPIYFAPNHWANGKTAIELGIAIDATTLNK